MNKYSYHIPLVILLFLASSCEDDLSEPIVKTTGATPGSIDAEVTGRIVSSGGERITQFGICISSETDHPTVESSPGPFYTEPVPREFTMTVPQLEPNTVYYVRAYAINKLGTGY